MEQVSVIPVSWLVALLIGGAILAISLWTRVREENDRLSRANEQLAARLEGRTARYVPVRPAIRFPAGRRLWLKPALSALILLPCLSLTMLPVPTGYRITGSLPPELPPPQILIARIVEEPAAEAQVAEEEPRLPPDRSRCAPLTMREARRIARFTARRVGLDPDLILAVIHHESSFQPCAVSRSGAQGLMQLKPGTAWEVGVSDPFDPVDNITGGARYLSYLLARYRGDMKLALGAYKEGMAVVDRHHGLPPMEETHRYVDGILKMAKDLGAD